MLNINFNNEPKVYLKFFLYFIIIQFFLNIFTFYFLNNYIIVDENKYEKLIINQKTLSCLEVKLCYDYYNDIFKDNKITKKEYIKAIEIFNEYN